MQRMIPATVVPERTHFVKLLHMCFRDVQVENQNYPGGNTSRRSFNSPSEEIFILSFPRYDKNLLFPEMHFQFCDLTKKVFCLMVGVSVN